MKVRSFAKTAVTLFFVATLIMTFIISPVLANIDSVDVSSGPTKLGTANFGATDLDYPKSETLTGGKVEPNVTVGDENKLNSTNEWSEFIGDDRCSAQLVIGINNEILDAYTRLMDIIAKHDCEVVNTVSMAGETIAVVVNVSLAEMSSFVEEMRADGLSRYIRPRMKVQAQFIPNDPYWSLQWGPQKIEADWAWNTTIGDPSVLVAVIDTGVDWDHPDLAANYVALGYDWVNNDTDPMDDEGHGTHCAGIIAAVINNSIGVAGLAQVRIMAEKGLDQYGEGYEDNLANAIIHAVNHGADILSNSWGGYGEMELIHDAVRYAYNAGVLVIAAAGNEATSTRLYPAAYDEVIAVTATDRYDNPAYFTNFGEWIELAAPGVDIYSTYWDNTYRSMSGTSMSTPHVSGVAALIWSQFPNMTRDWVRAQLRFTADDLGDPGFDYYYGYGRLNARNAVEQAPPDHDLLIFNWEKPRYIQPGDLVSFNVTVLNYGMTNESNITVQLLVDGNLTDSASIGFLASVTSTTVGVSWNPTVEGIYNVTFYVVPVPGETAIENNVVTEMIEVRYPIGSVLFDQTHGTDSIAYYSIWVANLTDRAYVVDTLTTSPITPSMLEGYDVFVIPQAHDYYSPDELSAIQDFVLGGGGLLVIGDDTPYIYTDLTGFVGIDWTGGGVSGITYDITFHEVTEGVTSVYLDAPIAEMLVTAPALDLVRDPAGGIMLAVSEQVGRVIGFADEGSLWDYGIGYEDNLRLANNMIDWLLGVKYEHELVVRLDAPNLLEPSDSSLLNATVYNNGLSNETDVELQLLINGTEVESAVIPELLSGSSYTLSHLWTPTIEGIYNVTAYAPPVPGENLTVNNMMSVFVSVQYLEVALFKNVDPWDYPENEEVLSLYGIAYAVFSSSDFGLVDLSSFSKVVIASDQDQAFYNAMDAYRWWFEDYVSSGGVLEVHAADLGWHGGQWVGTLPGGLGWAHYASDYVTIVDPTHPVVTTPNPITDPELDGWSASVHGYFSTYPADSRIVIIEDSTGYPAYLEFDYGSGFIVASSQTLEWAYMHGYSLILENSLLYTPMKYQHDLAVTLDAPNVLEPGDSSLLNATVYNRGLSNETDVELFLLINGTVVNNVTIPELVNDTYYTLSYFWTPTVEAVYNVTAYAQPVPDEEFTKNNVDTKMILVIEIVVENVLVYTDDAYVAPSSRYPIVALKNLGITYTHYPDDPTGFVTALTTQTWDLVIVSHNNYYAFGNNWEELEEYVLNGGLLVLSTFDIDGSHSEPTTLWSTLGVQWVSDMPYPEPVYRWIPTHPIFTFPNTIGDLTSYIEGYGDNGDHVAATTGTPIAGFTTSPTTGYAAIVVGNIYRTVLISFLVCEFRYDEDADGKLDTVELWENSIAHVVARPENELVVSLEAPNFLEPGDSSLLNATVYNRGLNNETNVELRLLINGSIVDSVVISELLTDSSYTLSYLWTPTIEGIYNVTAYAPPVPDENVTANNVKSVLVLVLPDILIVNDNDGSSWITGTSLQEFESALTAAGYDYWVWNESSMGNLPLGFLTKFQLVIWTCGDYWNWAVDPADAATLQSYLAQGGNILLEGEDIGYDHHADDFMVNVAHAIYQVDDTGAPGLTVTDSTHPVTFGLPTSFTWLTDPPYDDGVSPTNGGAEVVQYTGTTWTAVTVFEGASSGSVVYYAFPLYCLAESHGETLAINSINWLLGVRYEHELAVALEAPDHLEPGDSSLLNATVYNRGLNNETDVELFLLINGTEVNHVTIPELVNGTSYTINYLWTPTVEGIYNLTAYAPPVPGENFTANNYYTMHARVELLPLLPLISLNPMKYTACLGESFTINVYITKVTDMRGFMFKLDYDTTILDATLVSSTPISDDATVWVPVDENMTFHWDGPPTINDPIGRVWVGCWGFTTFTGSGAVLTISFTATAVGNSTLHLYETEILDYLADPIEHTTLDGEVTVTPLYTLTVFSSPTGVTFMVDNVSRTTPWSGTYSEGTSVSLAMPGTHIVGEARYYWDQWSDGVTSRLRTVTMNSNITLTAHYTGPYYQLTVTSSPITGIPFTIDGGPQTTPYTELLLEGSYTLVMPETHNGYVWSHWLEDGDTNRIKTITLQGTTWTAVYVPAPPPPVGGKATPINIPMNKPETPALWMWLSTIILPLVATVVFLKLKKKKQ